MTKPDPEIAPVARSSLRAQIRDAIFAEIEAEVLRPGEQLPSDSDYAKRFGVSLSPVRQAMADLASAGAIDRVPGRGSFVAAAEQRRTIRLLDSITAELREAGIPFEVTSIREELDVADAEVAPRLEIDVGDQIVVVERVISLEDGPLVHMCSHLPAARFGDLADPGRQRSESLFETLRNNFGVELHEATGEVLAAACNSTIATHLRCSVGAVALRLEATIYDVNGQPVDHQVSTYARRGVSLRFAQLAGMSSLADAARARQEEGA